MNLKFKRNFPMIILLLAFLTFLLVAAGSQPILAYTGI